MRRWGGCYSGVVETGGGDGSAMLRDLNMREERAGTGVGGCGCYRTGSVGDGRGVARPTGISAAVAPALESGTTHTNAHNRRQAIALTCGRIVALIHRDCHTKRTKTR